MPQGTISRIFYLQYVKLGDILRAIRGALLAALGYSILINLSWHFLRPYGASNSWSGFGLWVRSLPGEITVLALLLIIAWVKRGKTLTVSFPSLTLGEWAFCVVLAASALWSERYLPEWANVTIFLTVIQLGSALENLVALGKASHRERQNQRFSETG